jgi:putative colanic acid biosynthesis acetyltransferase WcaF
MREKIGRAMWMLGGGLAFRMTPSGCHRVRRAVLRLFGADIGKGVRIARTVRVEIPWNLTIGDGVVVSDRAILYCLGPVTIGKGVFIGPLAHICAGTHDYRSRVFTLLREPIVIGDGCALLTASFVGPRVVMAEGSVLGPRGALFKSTKPGVRYDGSPAMPAREES